MDSPVVVASRFRVEQPIAAGGQGRIFLATDLTNFEPVALKYLSLEGPEAVGRFEREAEILRSISHPNIARYISHGKSGEAWYLVMELIKGESLSSRIQREGLTVDETLRVGKQVAAALALLHQRGLVHRDVKPGNVMVPSQGVEPATLVDFGLARAAERLSSLTRTGTAVGSPGYMSPEQALAKPPTPASDVYSLGCLLYVALTGYQPFPGMVALAVQIKILALTPPAPHIRNEDCPAPLSALVMRMLSRDPLDRPRDGAEALALLNRLEPCGSTRRARLVFRPQGPASASPSTDTPTETVSAKSTHFSIAMSLGGDDDEADVDLSPGIEDQLHELARVHGGTVAIMRDGTCVFISAPPTSPVDRTVSGAQCALELFSAFPGRSVALAVMMGTGEDVVDRAVQLLAAEEMQALLPGAVRRGVRIDQPTRDLLGEPMETVAHGKQLYLIAMH